MVETVRWLGLLLIACGHTARDGEPPPEPAQAGTQSSPSAGAGGAAGGRPNTGIERGGAGGHAGEVSMDPVTEAGSAGTKPEPEAHAASPCEAPQPLPGGGGFEVCKDSSLRRHEAAACLSALPRAEPVSGAIYDECVYDADCSETANGYCVVGACYYGCTTDADCGDGVCFCGEVIGSCQGAECRSDADCPSDYPCSGNRLTGTDNVELVCQTPTDACQTDADCDPSQPRVHCVSDGTRRLCVRDWVG